MENEQININVTPNGRGELIIRHGEALRQYYPDQQMIRCTLWGVHEWIQKREIKCEYALSLITYDTNKGKIRYIEQVDYKLSHEITGQITLDPSLEAFDINSGNYVSPDDMANRIRSLAHCFSNRSDVMKLVSTLKNFEANVNQDVKSESNDRGNLKKLRSQVVDSNLPDEFRVFTPIIKGSERQTVRVEIHANESLQVTLFSYDLIEVLNETRRDEVMIEVDRLRESFPDIPIIEI